MAHPFVECDYTRDSSKSFFDLTHSLHSNSRRKPNGTAASTLTQLLVTGFDCEQIWQQIEHRYNTSADIHSAGTDSLHSEEPSLGIIVGNHSLLNVNGTNLDSLSESVDPGHEQSDEDDMPDVYASSQQEIGMDEDEGREVMSEEDEAEYPANVSCCV